MRKCIKALTKLHEVDREVLVRVFKKSGCEGHGDRAMINLSQLYATLNPISVFTSMVVKGTGNPFL